MKLENNKLKLTIENKGGEMSSLIYKGMNILYDGKGEYWSGKNPTLFPIISSPNSKQYTFNGVTYPIKNHGLIRYATLDTIEDDGKQVVLELKANEETLAQYPFNFKYQIKYEIDDNRVIVSYVIKNIDDKVMPFTFGIHPGFVCDLQNDSVYFDKDNSAQILIDKRTKESIEKPLGTYKLIDFVDDIEKYETVVFKPLKTKTYELIRNDYRVKIYGEQFKYVAMWTPNRNANFLCIEPWCSIDYIKETNNPFSDEFELHYLKPQDEFNISYIIEVE